MTTLGWAQLPTTRARGDDWVTGHIWIAQGHSHGYTISELPAALVEKSSFKRWMTTVTANDHSSGDGWLSDTIEEAKQRAEDHEQQENPDSRD